MIGAHHTTGSNATSGSAETPVLASGAAKKPAANSSESPGRNGKNTTPVSTKTMRKMNPRVGATPMAIQLAIAVRGSLSRLTKKLMIPIGFVIGLSVSLLFDGPSAWRRTAYGFTQSPHEWTPMNAAVTRTSHGTSLPANRPFGL